MPKKLRVTVTSVIEYEPNPEHYPGATNIEAMAEIDRIFYTDDPDSILVRDPATTVKVEVVE